MTEAADAWQATAGLDEDEDADAGGTQAASGARSELRAKELELKEKVFAAGGLSHLEVVKAARQISAEARA